MTQRYRILCWMPAWTRFDPVLPMGQVCQLYRNCYMYDKKYLNRNYKYYSVKVPKIYVPALPVCFLFFWWSKQSWKVLFIIQSSVPLFKVPKKNYNYTSNHKIPKYLLMLTFSFSNNIWGNNMISLTMTAWISDWIL